MNELLGSIPIIGGMSNMNWGFIAIVTLMIIVVVLSIMGLFFFMLHRKRTTSVIEIDLISHKIKHFNGMIKKDPSSKAERFWISKYKKFIKRFKQEHLFYKGNRDTLILIKDTNGLHHPLKIMDIAELTEYMQKCKGIDITHEFITKEDGTKAENPYYSNYQVYSMPQPSENLEWLGKECVEANLEYKKTTEWWQSPTVMMIGVAFICFLMFVMTIILTKK